MERSASRDRTLEWALLANFLVHGLAMVGMALFLLPALPGGSAPSDSARVTYIAEHAWLFRLGWLPWQLCAVADLALAVAMVRVRWLPRVGTTLVLLFTLIAVMPDQYAQALWITRGVELAQTDAAAYLAFERQVFPLTAAWGALFYTLAALGWTYSFAKAGTWSRALTLLSVPLWSVMGIAVVSPLLPPGMRPSSAFVSASNGIGFTLLQVWLVMVTEKVLQRARPEEPWGRLARWKYPGAGPVARTFDWLANSRFMGALLEPLPELTMRSNISHVVYVNYLIPAARAQEMVPEGLTLQRLGPDGAWALFSFLTYQHGHFGFALLGPLRRLMPSPVQTNWRIHIEIPETKVRGIYFLTNAVTHVVPALCARLLTEGMPMHVLAKGNITRREDGAISVALEPGAGSAPDATLDLRPGAAPELTGEWKECFPDWNAFLAYCVPQDRAISSQPLRGRLSRQEIDLGIPVSACVPLDGSVISRRAKEIAGDAAPLCFYVPSVNFLFEKELHERRE